MVSGAHSPGHVLLSWTRITFTRFFSIIVYYCHFFELTQNLTCMFTWQPLVPLLKVKLLVGYM